MCILNSSKFWSQEWKSLKFWSQEYDLLQHDTVQKIVFPFTCSWPYFSESSKSVVALLAIVIYWLVESSEEMFLKCFYSFWCLFAVTIFPFVQISRNIYKVVSWINSLTLKDLARSSESLHMVCGGLWLVLPKFL